MAGIIIIQSISNSNDSTATFYYKY